jgi:hypothetical protein
VVGGKVPAERIGDALARRGIGDHEGTAVYASLAEDIVAFAGAYDGDVE